MEESSLSHKQWMDSCCVEDSVAHLEASLEAARAHLLAHVDEIRAKAVCSGLEPRLTMLKLAGRDNLPPDYAERLGRFRLRGSSGGEKKCEQHFLQQICKRSS